MSTTSPVRSSTMVQGQFYRRPLPSCCISFCSNEGKIIFREAMMSGHMETYFALAAQFCTQEEPAFCGLSTLVMVLNALEVDPKKVWKGPWRWYHEQMLDCCVPLEVRTLTRNFKVIEKSGITIDQFACLAICNTLSVQMFRVDSSVTEDQFRQLVASKSRCADEVVVVSYSRKAVEQTGDGHFSPLGGYHPERDLVLIFDVARFKYPPHWISLSLLFEAMKCLDKTTELPRGYMLLKKSSSQPTVLFRFCPQFSVTCSTRTTNTTTADVLRCVEAWQKFLNEPHCEESSTDTQPGLLRWCIIQLLNTLDLYGHDVILLTTQVEASDNISDEHKQAITDLLRVLESLQIFSLVKDVISNRTAASESSVTSDNGIHSNGSSPYALTKAHYLTMLVLLWPYSTEQCYSRGVKMHDIVSAQLNMCCGSDRILLHNEVRQLRQQLESVLGYTINCCSCQCQSQSFT